MVVVVGFSRELAGRQRRRDCAWHDRIKSKRRFVSKARVTVAIERSAVAEIHAPDRSCETHAAVKINRRIVDWLHGFEDTSVRRKREVEEKRSAERTRTGALLVTGIRIDRPLRSQVRAVVEALLGARDRERAFGGRRRDRGDLVRRAAARNERTRQGQRVRADAVPDRFRIVRQHVRHVAQEGLNLVAAGAPEHGLIILVVVAEPTRAHIRVGTVLGPLEAQIEQAENQAAVPVDVTVPQRIAIIAAGTEQADLQDPVRLPVAVRVCLHRRRRARVQIAGRRAVLPCDQPRGAAIVATGGRGASCRIELVGMPGVHANPTVGVRQHAPTHRHPRESRDPVSLQHAKGARSRAASGRREEEGIDAHLEPSAPYSWNFGPDGAFEPWMFAWQVMQPRPMMRSSGCAPVASDCGVCRSFG